MPIDPNETEPDQALPLPGLEVLPKQPAAALEVAVRRTIVALKAQDLLTEADAATLQMMIELAEIIAMKKATKRASTISNDLRLLWEIKDSFTVADDDADKKLEQAMAAMEEWAQESGASP